MADIFLSYKKADKDRVEGLAADLTEEGFTVWWDTELKSGDEWEGVIHREVMLARCLVGCWTRHAVDARGLFVPSSEGKGNNYLRMEHEWAGRTKIAGALMDPGCAPAAYNDLQFADLTTWTPGSRSHAGFRDLVERAEKLATPAFVQRTLAAYDARRSEALDQLAASRSRADGLLLELNRKSAEAAKVTETLEAERRAFEQERQATGAVILTERQAREAAQAKAAQAGADLLSVQTRLASSEAAALESGRAVKELEANTRRLADEHAAELSEHLAAAKQEQSALEARLTSELEEARTRKGSSAPAWMAGLAALAIGAAGGWLLKATPEVGTPLEAGVGSPSDAVFENQAAANRAVADAARSDMDLLNALALQGRWVSTGLMGADVCSSAFRLELRGEAGAPVVAIDGYIEQITGRDEQGRILTDSASYGLVGDTLTIAAAGESDTQEFMRCAD